jgi:uncharacterized protein YkwD
MVQPNPAPRLRRLASVVLASMAILAIAAPGGASAATATATTATDDPSVSALELDMVAALNQNRTDLGLVPVRIDSRLMAIARARSNDMVAKDYFSHTQPDGRNVFDILSTQHISWYNAGEIIAWNNYPIDSTVSAADRQWMGSPGHKAIIISGDFNYVGVGLALDPATGKKLWTAVYIKGPDRTAAQATAYTPQLGSWTSSRTRTAKVAWTGYDPRLQVLTAGLRSFTIQIRTDGGAWRTISSSTTSKAFSFRAWKGHWYQLRIAARDRAGNQGAWVTKTIDLR